MTNWSRLDFKAATFVVTYPFFFSQQVGIWIASDTDLSYCTFPKICLINSYT